MGSASGTNARMRHEKAPSIRGFGFGNQCMNEAQKGSVDSWVQLREIEARKRHRRVPSVCGFGFRKPRHERGTEGFCRFVGSASGTNAQMRHGRAPSIRGFGFGNRYMNEAQKGSVDSWVRLWELMHGRAPA
ncbi:hypothetical protein RHGRI_008724 [Rhododendron griersonianum]|uniref:Uncharacterized protein n=1 Tax=Rhododendron griersonianum TaxID=479676 RepID=A0AAV6L3L9_9ERIC|nr:hypothetical protein RHGRI_008724 [Rhododendron griersonianum]